MKQTILFICALFCAAIGWAQNSVALSSVAGHPGDEVTVDVSLNCGDGITAAEIVVPLTDKQLKYVDGSCVLNSERTDGHMMSAAMVDGSLKIYIYSIALKSIKSGEGRLASFKLSLGKAPADYTMQPQVVLSDAKGAPLQVDATTGTATILSPQIEAVTKKVDYGHIPIRSEYTNTLTLRNSGNEPLRVSALQFSAAEFGCDESEFTIEAGGSRDVTLKYSPTVRGKINESVTVVSNAINGKIEVALVADPYSVNELHSSEAQGVVDEEVTVELRMNNMEPIVGMQCLFQLPDELKYVDGSFAPATRASKHTASSTFKDGKLTLMLHSLTNTAVDGDDGILATFRLRLNGNSGYYQIEPQNVVLSNKTLENMTSGSSGNAIIIKSPSMSSSEELQMGGAAVTSVAKAEYAISNNGETPLTISKVTFLAEGYKVTNELPLVIAPYSAASLNVEYTPTKEGSYSTTMNIYTNDPLNRMKAVKVSGNIYEPNSIVVDGENLKNGDYRLSVGMNNYTDIVALQMDIHWMKGMTTSEDLLATTERLKGHSLTLAKLDDDSYRVIVFSMSNKAIAGKEGEIFTLDFKPNNGTVYKDSEITIDNIILSNSESNNYNSKQTATAKAEYKNFYVWFVLDRDTIAEQFGKVGETVIVPSAPEKNGYTFTGWKNLPKTIPVGNVVCDGSYDANKYNIIYKVDGTEYQTVQTAYGSAITLINAPTKEGHTFSGWSEAPETMPAKDITINGTFAVNSYKVTYMVYGKEYQSTTLAYGSAITLIDAPTKEGYTFSGWSEAPETMPAKDITISGTFAVNSYKVTYMVDGKEYQSATLAYGSAITLINAPTKEGHTFSGWSEAPPTMPAKDITINGTFAVNSYKVTYMVDGKEYLSATLAYGSVITLIDAPTKEGYTFSGWSEAPETMPAKDIVINGTFAVNGYKITYIVDDKEYQSITLAYGSAITLIEAPTKEGYTFSGWSEAPETMPAKDITINGTFAVNGYKITYIVDGKEYQSTTLAYGSAITLIDAPTKDGYAFSGWSEAPETMPAKDIVISGSFTVNSYTVTYKVDGTEFKTMNVNYGEKIVLIEAPTKDGFTFSGWTDAPDVMPAKDIIINGTFLTNAYAITYVVDGKEYRTIQVSYGAKIELIEAPTKEGHTFSGWSEAPETMPAKDITINGTFAVNSYKITYTVDGKEYQSATVTYGSAITLIEAPTKDGYTFSGWSEAPETMPAKDITINGTFAVNSYKVTYMVYGKEYQSTTLAYGSAITLIDAPTKEGYTFSGWSEAPETMPAKDITISGTFAVNSYKVTYMVDGKEYQSTTLAYDSAITLIEAPTKEGYTFSGWSEAPETMPAKDITINGTFAVNSYKVTYTVDGTEFKTVNVNYGEKIVLIEAPTKDGFTFSGWTDAPDVMPAKDIIINGTFLTNAYAITYVVDGKEYRTIQVSYGAKIELIEAPTKEGHTFSGWSEAPETMPAKDITINGTFAVNSYKIVYTVDGMAYDSTTVAFGAEIKLIEAPAKEGYTFSGWSEAPETMPAKDITISGTFAVNSYKVVYTVDGVAYDSATVAFGAEIKLIEAPAKEGYTFSGWSEAPETMPAKDITISGTFAVNSYKIVYTVDGVAYDSTTVAFGAEIKLIEAPNKEGYTFSGWSEAPETMPAKDITISGTFNVNYYTLTYIVDGEEYKVEQVAFGSEIVLADIPVKEDHIFSGWSEAPTTMPAEDLVITGTFVHTSINGTVTDAIVTVKGNSVILSGINGKNVAIYTSSGAIIERIDKYDGTGIILDKGLYIIRIDNKSLKVRL